MDEADQLSQVADRKTQFATMAALARQSAADDMLAVRRQACSGFAVISLRSSRWGTDSPSLLRGAAQEALVLSCDCGQA